MQGLNESFLTSLAVKISQRWKSWGVYSFAEKNHFSKTKRHLKQNVSARYSVEVAHLHHIDTIDIALPADIGPGLRPGGQDKGCRHFLRKEMKSIFCI